MSHDIDKMLREMGFSSFESKDIEQMVRDKIAFEKAGSNFRDCVAARGHLRILMGRKGVWTNLRSEPNLIVDNGLLVMTQVFGDAASPNLFAQKKPSLIAVGTNNTDAAAGDTALGAQVFEDTFDSTTFPTNSSVRFDMTILQAEANGDTLSEAGVKSVDSTLISRSIFGPIAKDSNFQLSFQWTFTFARP